MESSMYDILKKKKKNRHRQHLYREFVIARPLFFNADSCIDGAVFFLLMLLLLLSEKLLLLQPTADERRRGWREEGGGRRKEASLLAMCIRPAV